MSRSTYMYIIYYLYTECRTAIPTVTDGATVLSNSQDWRRSSGSSEASGSQAMFIQVPIERGPAACSWKEDFALGQYSVAAQSTTTTAMCILYKCYIGVFTVNVLCIYGSLYIRI